MWGEHLGGSTMDAHAAHQDTRPEEAGLIVRFWNRQQVRHQEQEKCNKMPKQTRKKTSPEKDDTMMLEEELEGGPEQQ